MSHQQQQYTHEAQAAHAYAAYGDPYDRPSYDGDEDDEAEPAAELCIFCRRSPAAVAGACLQCDHVAADVADDDNCTCPF